MKHPKPSNPFAAPDCNVEIVFSTSKSVCNPLTFKQKVYRTLSSVLIAAIFLSNCFIAVIYFNNRQWASAFVVGTAALMCLPFLSDSVPLRIRFISSALVTFAMAGMACALKMFFWIRDFPNFDAIVPDSGNRPLIIFVAFLSCMLLGTAIGGYIGWRLLDRFGFMTAKKEDDTIR